jgi:LuxR family maltose regulon positive regulatory protein
VKKGQIAEAIRHALAGGSYDAAADLIPRATRPAIFRGATFGLSAWYRALPEDVLRTRPELAIGYAWVLIDFRDLEHAEERLRHAEVALETRADLFAADYCQELQTLIEITRAVIEVMHGNVDRAISRAAEAMDSPAAFDAGTQGSAYFDVIEVRSAGNFALGLAHLSHRAIKEAADYFGRVAADNRDTADRSVFLVLGTAGLASAQRLAGQLDLARAAYERAIEWSTGYAEVPVRAGSHYTGLADVLRERNELDAALEHAMYGLGLEPSLRTPGAERWVEWNVCNVLVLARVKQARGDLNGALADVHEAREQIKRFGTIAFTAILDAFEAQLQLAQGNIDAAVRWLRTAEAQPTPLRVGLTPHVVLYVSEHPEIAPAQVLVAQGRACCASAPLQRALTVLDDLQNKAKRSGMVWLRAKALVLEALARQALGERAAACSALDAALALAEPVGAMRLFLDEGPALADLLRDRRTHGSNPAYAADILSALDVRTLSHQGSTEARNRPAAEPLTERELEVLRLLATGQSAPQIARALYVEVNTVRTHVKHLYGKLGVHSRDQAVWRARELGLLPRDHPAISPSW